MKDENQSCSGWMLSDDRTYFLIAFSFKGILASKNFTVAAQ
jgi:hypothetical protein